MEDKKQSYLEYLKIRNFSERTIKGKSFGIEYFINYIRNKGIENFDKVTEEDIKEYQKYRYYYQNKIGIQDSPGHQNWHISTVKQFFKYLIKSGELNYNPAQNIELVKEPKRLPKSALTHKEVKKIINQININEPLGYRDRTILEVLYSSGIRRSELTNIKLKDVKLEEGTIRINKGKGNKDRMVPIGKIAIKYLEGYIKFVRKEILKNKESEYLFISKKQNKLSIDRLGDIVKMYAQMSGIEKEVTTHTFRRSCATEMIRREAKIMYVKELLGHKSLETI